MSNLHRIAWIDAQIRAGRHPNARTIAAHFEISRRQAARDLEYLRHSMGAPLVYSPAENGYAYADDSFVLPAVVVSEPERAALGYLAERYAAIDGETAARVAGVLRRLAGRAVADPGSDERPPVAGLDGREVRAFDAARAAIEARRVLSVRYRGADGVVVARTFSPYAVLTRYGALSCVAYCDDVGVTGVFPLGRFENVEQTDRPFEVPPLFDLDEWRDERSPLRPEPFTAVVRLEDPTDAERLEAAVASDDGTYRIEFHDSGAILAALLACRSGFEIVAPRWLRERLLRRLEGLLRSHGGAAGEETGPPPS